MMNTKTKLSQLKKFELPNPETIEGGKEPPIIDKKLLKAMQRRRR